MTPLALLLEEIWRKDNTIRIEQEAFSRYVVMTNKDATIYVKTPSLGETIMQVWALFYGKEQELVFG